MTLDPTHIGAGGYRLGRVDNSIIREPGTDLPKIPGTSLSGAIRSYAAYRYGKISCAGQGQEREDEIEENGEKIKRKKDGHCGKAACPICYTFGYTVKGDDDAERSHSGTVNLFDAHLILFPVHSMIGPVWVSTPQRLEEFGFTFNDGEPKPNEIPGKESFVTTAEAEGLNMLNLGWLMLPVETRRATVTPPTKNWAGSDEWKSIAKRIVLAPETLFSQLVNANLEVRTSVSINPETGAAQKGALFTYEAIPRGALLVFDVVQDDYRRRGPNPSWTVSHAVKKVNGQWQNDPDRPLYPDKDNPSQPRQENGQEKAWRSPADVVQGGLEWAAALGVGGMSTRGFGRFKAIGSRWEVTRG
ncbi:MAG: type III-B CRISPR module RAMP protein Cmr4, partial [Acidobacteriales bacterium]|nr:type III-B CRISPR module RAMP protein Cmr4 [Terriglobales bacterium]